LDEICVEFLKYPGKYLHLSTIWRYITTKIGYTLKVLTSIAKQQCEDEATMFHNALNLYLQGDIDRLIMIDESHKDRNAGRRRRGWSRRNLEGTTVREWHLNSVRYTLMAAGDVNGFKPCACHTVLRDEISDKSEAGTVDGEYFLSWVKEFLCPVLGKYEFGEVRSVVLMDNASTHMLDEIQRAINAAGAVSIYGPPFSPHLNPIEPYFNLYKSHLKQNEARMNKNWLEVHHEALNIVDRSNGIKYFRRSQIPGSELAITAEEYYNFINMFNI